MGTQVKADGVVCPEDVRSLLASHPEAAAFVLTRGDLERVVSCFPYNHPPSSVDVDALATALAAKMKEASNG